MSLQPMQSGTTANIETAATRPVGDEKAKKNSKRARFVALLLGAAVFLILPARPPGLHAQAAACGPFTDVPGSDAFCPFIAEAFNLGVTNGTSPTTFSPSTLVPRGQMVTFFGRVMDFTLHRGRRTAIGRTWAPTSTAGGVPLNVGGTVNDIVSDGTFLWVARGDGAILKMNAADRTVLQTWRISAGTPFRLGVFAGRVWIVDIQGNLSVFDPSTAPGTVGPLIASVVAAGFPTLAFDGNFVWIGSTGGAKIATYEVSSPAGTGFATPASVHGLVFDGTFMWMLLSNGHLQRMNVPTASGVAPILAEDITLPGGESDCRMVFDGNSIWIPSGSGVVYVIRPAQSVLSSSVILNQALPSVNFPYVASFDGENVMIGGVNSGTVALFKATSLSLIRSFDTGAVGVRGIGSDGLTFNVGDGFGTKSVQY